jgi:pyruvate kinase
MTRRSEPKTKIVCTIGPASRSPEILEKLVLAGMSVARLNFSYGTHAEHKKTVSRIRRLSRDLGTPVAILQDLSGPKIRIGKIEAGTVALDPGSVFTLTARRVPGTARIASVNYPGLIKDVYPGDLLLLGDGAIELEVVEAAGPDIRCRVNVGGPLSSFKGVNLPSRSVHLPSLTGKDKADLHFGLGAGVDYVALSFVRAAADIRKTQAFIKKHGGAIPVIAKIEKHEALDDLEGIIRASDGVMVARGDLGVEIPLEKIPRVQKLIIRSANRHGKPVITATQMLRSMVENPRPTRAEVTDVANAVLDGTDALMLSEETAVGRYPEEAVRTMAKIAEESEQIPGLDDRAGGNVAGNHEVLSTGEAVAMAACSLAGKVRAALMITFTYSGSTARLVSKYRPPCPILAPTPLEETYRRSALLWGVLPLRRGKLKSTDGMIRQAFRAALESGLARRGDKVVITAGVPPGVPGRTNMIKVEILK